MANTLIFFAEKMLSSFCIAKFPAGTQHWNNVDFNVKKLNQRWIDLVSTLCAAGVTTFFAAKQPCIWKYLNLQQLTWAQLFKVSLA